MANLTDLELADVVLQFQTNDDHDGLASHLDGAGFPLFVLNALEPSFAARAAMAFVRSRYPGLNIVLDLVSPRVADEMYQIYPDSAILPHLSSEGVVALSHNASYDDRFRALERNLLKGEGTHWSAEAISYLLRDVALSPGSRSPSHTDARLWELLVAASPTLRFARTRSESLFLDLMSPAFRDELFASGRLWDHPQYAAIPHLLARLVRHVSGEELLPECTAEVVLSYLEFRHATTAVRDCVALDVPEEFAGSFLARSLRVLPLKSVSGFRWDISIPLIVGANPWVGPVLVQWCHTPRELELWGLEEDGSVSPRPRKGAELTAAEAWERFSLEDWVRFRLEHVPGVPGETLRAFLEHNGGIPLQDAAPALRAML